MSDAAMFDAAMFDAAMFDAAMSDAAMFDAAMSGKFLFSGGGPFSLFRVRNTPLPKRKFVFSAIFN
jgi:hypothetical protein